MATLVLTALGTAVGGPLGAAIGGVIGNYVDHATIFRPATREGPRLAELAVQTSSYGSAIPRLFGTMRVAGTVIWATDLIETRSKASGGKGQPSVATYSYAASFAVLLSGRPIVGIGRIWADGRLLRGAAGDLKVKALLRVHRGGEDQAADPLIASAEGGVTPAYRGAAYLVFEQLPLAEFGNRIPSLTVEVIADAGAVAVGEIARGVAGEVAAGPARGIAGFAAAGSVRGVLGVLAVAANGWWCGEGERLRLDDGAGAVRTVADRAVAAVGLAGPARGRSLTAVERTARVVAVSHYDAARDYQAGVQRAARPGAGDIVRRVEMPAVLSAGEAKALAEARLAREAADRTRRTLTLGLDAIDLAPGALVRVAGEDGRWRVIEATVEAMAVRLVLAPVVAGAVAGPAAGGRVNGAVDAVIGRTVLRVIETPVLDDALAPAPRLTVAAAGEGAAWRQAALLWSADDGASWTPAGATAAPAVIGVVEQALPAASAALFDEGNALVVRLATAAMMLHDADDAALDRGENLAAVGNELIQFGRAVPLGGRRWRLTHLLRGRRGSETGGSEAGGGDGFVLLTAETARVIELPVAAVGRTVRVMASGIGDDVPVEARVVVTGVAMRPPSPVHLRIERRADGALDLRWVRRSRAGWRWIDGVDVPLAEEAERYRVTVTAAAGVTEIEVAEPRLRMPADARRIAVRQRGTWGESAPAILVTDQGLVPDEGDAA